MKPDPAGSPDRAAWRVLALLCFAVVLSMSVWFSATAVSPELISAWHLADATAAWMTNGVQIGFVSGALLASLVNLPDIVRLNRLMAASAMLAALANAGLLLEPSPAIAISLRIVTGLALAGVYPPAMKLTATWFERSRGLALGAVIAALTAGSSLPHLFRAVADTPDWRVIVAAASVAAVLGGLLFLIFVREGPFPFSRAVFHPGQIGQVLRDRNLLLANLGYFGHMWELYAMWAWLLTYLRASSADGGGTGLSASALTCVAIASGVLGCLLGGLLSDRIGRTRTTAGMMIVSGACAGLIGFAFDGPQWLLMTIAVVWGIAVIGDSAQFSAAVTELADRRYVGTALSLQMAVGFALTVLSIWLLPRFADLIGGWQWSFLILVPGPLVGVIAMLRLRTEQAALRLSGGRR